MEKFFVQWLLLSYYFLQHTDIAPFVYLLLPIQHTTLNDVSVTFLPKKVHNALEKVDH